MNLFQEPLHPPSDSAAAAGNNSTAASASRGGTSLGVMNNMSKLFFANRRASNESLYSAKSGNSGAARSSVVVVVGERGGMSEEAFRHQQGEEQARMDEFKAILAEVRLSNPGMSMAQAQHLALLKVSERKGGRNENGMSDSGNQKLERPRRRSLVAMDDKDENKNRLLLDNAKRDEDERRARNLNNRDYHYQDSSQSNRRSNIGPRAAAATFLRRNTRNLNPLSQSLPISVVKGASAKDADGVNNMVPDRNQPLIKRASVRDPMLQSIRQLQDELGEVDLSDEGGDSNDTGLGYHSGSGSGGAVSPASSRRGSMFRRRGSAASRDCGGRPRRRTSAASARSDLSIRSERSLEAERIRRGIAGKCDRNKKKNPIRASAKKLLRLGSNASSKKVRDGEEASAGSSQSGDNACHRPKRRASQAPSLPDIGEDENYEAQIKSDGDTSHSDRNLLQGGRRYSDISIEVPVGDLICRWNNSSRDSIGADSHGSFDESDGLICGWGTQSITSLAAANGSSRRNTMAGSSSEDDFALPLGNDDGRLENRRGSM